MALQDNKFKIDSGYIVPDPADPYRFMLIAYLAETDSAIIFRRAELTQSETNSPETNSPETSQHS